MKRNPDIGDVLMWHSPRGFWFLSVVVGREFRKRQLEKLTLKIDGMLNKVVVLAKMEKVDWRWPRTKLPVGEKRT
jgi:hypothetical protein